MTRSASVSVLGSEFDDFLFAPIREDRNDMPLSVLSALARLDIDPWQEAGKLARLPGETATQRLASLIAALPDGPSAHLDPGTIAARLIALLPSRASSKIPSRGTLLDAGEVTKFRAGICNVCCLYSLHAGRPMDRSKPSNAGAGRQRSCASFQHSLPADATAELWPVTIKWARATGGTMTRSDRAWIVSRFKSEQYYPAFLG